MGETREPRRGFWAVFEGDRHVASIEDARAFDESVNREIAWPVSLRVFHIRDGVMRSRDVEIDEQLEVAVRDLEEEPLARSESRAREPEAVSPDKEKRSSVA